MLKKLFASLLSFAIIATSFPATAADLSAAIQPFSGAAVSVNDPGRYQSGARDVFTAGGFDLRVPPAKNTTQLFSFTPPKVVAGCGGISSFFGGFSFISGKEFEQLLKNMASGAATGFVAHLAMKSLCPYCESVVQFLQRVNQAAAQAVKSSCNWGTQMGKQFEATTGFPGGYSMEAECKSVTAGTGAAKDAGDAEGSLCATAFGAVKSLEDAVKKMAETASPEDKAKALAGASDGLALGNIMWNATGKMFPGRDDPDILIFRLWLMNLTGTRLVGTGNNVSCAGNFPGDVVVGEKHPRISCPSTDGKFLDADDVMILLLCGASPPREAKGGHKNIADYCLQTNKLAQTSLSDRANRMVMTCDWSKEPAGSCDHVLMRNINEATLADGTTKMISGEGLLYQVRDILGEAVNRVVSNKPLYDASPGANDIVGQKLIRLLQVAPYPLYQVINAAAVYPTASLDLIDTMSLLIGESLAYSYTDEFLRVVGRSQVGGAVDENAVRRVNEALETMRAKVKDRKQLIVQNLTIQETLNANIRQINLAIQRQVMTSDILNGNKFSATMGGSVIGSNNGKGTAPATP